MENIIADAAQGLGSVVAGAIETAAPGVVTTALGDVIEAAAGAAGDVAGGEPPIMAAIEGGVTLAGSLGSIGSLPAPVALVPSPPATMADIDRLTAYAAGLAVRIETLEAARAAP